MNAKEAAKLLELATKLKGVKTTLSGIDQDLRVWHMASKYSTHMVGIEIDRVLEGMYRALGEAQVGGEV